MPLSHVLPYPLSSRSLTCVSLYITSPFYLMHNLDLYLPHNTYDIILKTKNRDNGRSPYSTIYEINRLDTRNKTKTTILTMMIDGTN